MGNQEIFIKNLFLCNYLINNDLSPERSPQNIVANITAAALSAQIMSFRIAHNKTSPPLPLSLNYRYLTGLGYTLASQPSLWKMLLNTDKYAPDPQWLAARVASYRATGHRIVLTNGCFDILHAGHVSYLERARELGDILIIAVNSDTSVSRLKGPSRPINPLEDRIQVLAALRCVDYLVPFDDNTPSNLIRIIRPDIYVKGGDYTKQTLPEASLVEQLGGDVQILPLVKNRSTTSIIERIRSSQ